MEHSPVCVDGPDWKSLSPANGGAANSPRGAAGHHPQMAGKSEARAEIFIQKKSSGRNSCAIVYFRFHYSASSNSDGKRRPY